MSDSGSDESSEDGRWVSTVQDDPWFQENGGVFSPEENPVFGFALLDECMWISIHVQGYESIGNGLYEVHVSPMCCVSSSCRAECVCSKDVFKMHIRPGHVFRLHAGFSERELNDRLPWSDSLKLGFARHGVGFSSRMTKYEAFLDFEVAANALTTADGLKTRNNFYRR